MNCEYLAELLFPDVTETPEDIEKKYPPRNLPEGAKVTRFAPSPTGFVHFGGLFPTTVGERLAHQSGGVFFLRIEDTDAKREIPGAAECLVRTLESYGIHFDEGAIIDADTGRLRDFGNYGPYKQSMRRNIYHVYAKQLVRKGLAYPCFTTEEELEALAQINKKEEIKSKDWQKEAQQQKEAMLAQRDFTIEYVESEIDAGHPFVLRILADGNPEKKISFYDLVKGKLEIPENDEDFVLLKSDGIPTYHFAHAVDDHLMGTTHVIRGEEWLPSVAKHLQLFRYLDFKLPKYIHIAQIMRLDENGHKKKLSKRDMGVNLEDYKKMGYTPECVCEYIMTLLNSNYEDWRMRNPDNSYTDFPFNIKKMSASGCLFDFNKLNDISKNVLSKMSAEQIYDKVLDYADEFDPEFAALLSESPDYAKKIFEIGRGGKKPRKDLVVLADAKPYMSFFYDKYFKIEDRPISEDTEVKFTAKDIRAALDEFIKTYDFSDDMNTWFDKIKVIADKLGFASDMKAYKNAPESFLGSVADISMFIRVAVTGRRNAPDLYTVMQILGYDTVISRIKNYTID